MDKIVFKVFIAFINYRKQIFDCSVLLWVTLYSGQDTIWVRTLLKCIFFETDYIRVRTLFESGFNWRVYGIHNMKISLGGRDKSNDENEILFKIPIQVNKYIILRIIDWNIALKWWNILLGGKHRKN